MPFWDYVGKAGVYYNMYQTRAIVEVFIIIFSQTILIIIGVLAAFIIICAIAQVRIRSKFANQKYIGITDTAVTTRIAWLQSTSIQYIDLFVQAGLMNHILIIITTFIFASLFPFVASFDFLDMVQCRVIMVAVFVIGAALQILNNLHYAKSDKFLRMFYSAIQNLRSILIVESIIALLMVILLPIFLQKGCLCYETYAYGISYLDGLQYSSEWMRRYWLPNKICPDNRICHLYATLPQNSTSEVFMNVHTGTNISNLRMQLNNRNFSCEKQMMSELIEERGQRIIYTCYAQNLSSNTVYDLKLFQDNIILQASRYKTLPSNNDTADLKILFGGDVSSLDEGKNLMSRIHLTDPDLIIIGGDVAYDNGNIHCYYSYDLLFSMLQTQFTELERIVPLILSVGNHDVGYEDYSGNNVTIDENGPLYFTYFPQKSINGRIPNISQRYPFNYHIMKDIIIFGLDSGYIYSHQQQVAAVWNILGQYPNLTPFAHYHVPMYPSCLDGTTWPRINQSKQEWVPLFDKFKFVGVFENHVHQFKRTFPLYNDKPSVNGTVYFGDGSMGASSVQCPDEDLTFGKGAIYENFFDVTQNYQSTHYWVMTYYQSKISNNQIIQSSIKLMIKNILKQIRVII